MIASSLTARPASALAIVLVPVLAILGAAALGGCDTKLPPQVIEVGPADYPPSAGTTDDDSWQSVGWLGDPWLRYSGQATLILEHELGREPSTVLVYLSFEEDGSGAALTAGDTARIVSVDDSFVTIRNDTNADFFLRLVIR
ncbi:MAG: hypothetical protein DRJ42_29415 [Deltaproteobacteria bacterium]|nr:MAG: hypothetical protein DRJ42_29415 [Deltaproteobacteria bacterium]